MKPDGRNIDPAAGRLLGEASEMRVDTLDEALPVELRAPVDRQAGVDPESPTYHDLPVVKAPPWFWYIPAYFWVGGVASGALVLAAAAHGRPELRPLVVRGRWLGTAGTIVGSGLLIADLGMPSRFLYMLRVFRPSSPLNAGTWILTFAGMAGGGASVLSWAPGRLGRIGDGAGLVAGVFGAPLGTYTGVVLVNTAMPLWMRARWTTPILFGCSALASAGWLLAMTLSDGPARRTAERLAIAGTAGELATSLAVTREIGDDRVLKPLKEGTTGWGWTAAKALALGSLAAAASGRRGAAGVLGLAGAVAVRFALFHAGMRSGADPRATFEPQQAERAARTVSSGVARREVAPSPPPIADPV